MSRFTLLLGGDVTPSPRLTAQVAGTRVVAADSGIRHAAPLGLAPELWVGDFDSVDAAMLDGHAHVPREVFPAEKDFTDGEIAIRIARERGATALLLAGAFGGARADHAFLHMTQALSLAGDGIEVLLSDGVQEGMALAPGSHEYGFAPGTMFSILAFSALSGLTVEGAKWPLDHVEVPLGSSLTISNVASGALRIALASGLALLLVHHLADAQEHN